MKNPFILWSHLSNYSVIVIWITLPPRAVRALSASLMISLPSLSATFCAKEIALPS